MTISNILLCAQSRPEHASAAAEELRKDHPGARIYHGAHEADSAGFVSPAWSDGPLPKGVRPEFALFVISNEAGYLRPVEIFKAFMSMVFTRPRLRETWVYAWSGKYRPSDRAGEVASRAWGFALLPLRLAALKTAYLACEILFPVINKKSRKGTPAVRKALLISLDLVGDLVWAAPAISSVKENNPDTVVHLLVHPKNMPLARMIKGVDEVIAFDAPWLAKLHDPKGETGRRAGRLNRLVTRLRLFCAGYDMAIDLRGDSGNIKLAYFTGAPARVGVLGRSMGALQPSRIKYMLTQPVQPAALSGLHILERNIGIMAEAGLCPVGGAAGPPVQDSRWLTPGSPEKERVKRLLADAQFKGSGPLIGIQPGASRVEKRWNIGGFAETARRMMQDYGARVVVAGSADERYLGAHIAASTPGVADLTGRTDMAGFAALVDICDLFITNETSAISIASAVGTPAVCLMTGVPELYGPYGIKSVVLQVRPECYNPVGEHCFCPYRYRCLQQITPDDVVGAAEKLLQAAGFSPAK